MTFLPILRPELLIGLAIIVLVIRMVALYRVLVRTASGGYGRVVLRWSGLTAATLLVFVAAFRPGLEPGETGPETTQSASSQQNVNVFFVVDRSVDSRVEDYAPDESRMAGIRADALALIDQFSEARFGVISFASKASLDWPLSNDVWSLQSMMRGLSPYIVVPRDAMYTVDAGAANDELARQLELAAKQYPDSTNLVFYFGEGAGGSRAEQAPFEVDSLAVAGGAVLGYGTTAGGPIPEAYGGAGVLYAADQQSGAPLTSRIDEKRLSEIADQLWVPYVHRSKSDPIYDAIPEVPDPPAATSVDISQQIKVIERTELYWVFSLLACVLLLLEIGATVSEFRRNRLTRGLLGR